MVPSKVFDTDGQLLEALQEGSDVLQNVTAQFAPLMSNFRVYFFWEQEKTDLGATRKYVSFDTCFPSVCEMPEVAKKSRLGRQGRLCSSDTGRYGEGWSSV